MTTAGTMPSWTPTMTACGSARTRSSSAMWASMPSRRITRGETTTWRSFSTTSIGRRYRGVTNASTGCEEHGCAGGSKPDASRALLRGRAGDGGRAHRPTPLVAVRQKPEVDRQSARKNESTVVTLACDRGARQRELRRHADDLLPYAAQQDESRVYDHLHPFELSVRRVIDHRGTLVPARRGRQRGMRRSALRASEP